MSQASIAERPVISSAKPEKETLRHGPSLLPREAQSGEGEKVSDAQSQRPLPPIRSFGRRSLNAGVEESGADNDTAHGFTESLRGTLDAFRRRISGPFPAESPHVASKNVIIGLTVAAFGVLALALTVYFSTGGNGETTTTHQRAETPAYAQPEPVPAPSIASPTATQPRAALPAAAPQEPAPKATAPQAQAPAAPVAQPSELPEMPDIPGIREAIAPQVREPVTPHVSKTAAP
ncbi:MAG: hypothetical protein J0L97_02195, partial [Alphaproteobacteria bacterium]|nr:hypothetical protein [Alphaproteobacteria bacterium]